MSVMPTIHSSTYRCEARPAIPVASLYAWYTVMCRSS